MQVLHGHAFGTFHVCPDNHNVHVSGVQRKVRLYTYWVGVA